MVSVALWTTRISTPGISKTHASSGVSPDISKRLWAVGMF